jgi:hypothetical protein
VVADFASAVDAVQCAVAVQEALAKEAQMRFRIGVRARKRLSRIAGTKLLPRRPVLCAKCRPHGANLTRRAEWF